MKQIERKVKSHARTFKKQVLNLKDPVIGKYGVSVVSKTRHRWQISLSRTMAEGKPWTVSGCIIPVIDQRSIQVSGSYSDKDSWNFGLAMWNNKIDSAEATQIIRIGWSNFSSKGLSWIFSWSKGDLTIRVPIAITTVASPFAFPLETVYLSIVSHVVQELLCRVLGVTPEQQAERKKRAKLQKRVEDQRQKPKKDAENQQFLLKNSAKKKMDAEKAKRGLVVRRAVYFLPGGESFDVTIPLQFWVNDSTLILADASKRDMLGFYDITAESSESNGTAGSNGGSSWFSGFWKSKYRENGLKSALKTTPKLKVEYTYAEKSFDVTIEDYESLNLPGRTVNV
jgi:hypothetical protein